MVWNKSIYSSKNSLWGSGSGGRSQNEGPPDLDEVFSKLSRRLGNKFGSGNKIRKGGGVWPSFSKGGGLSFFAALVVALIIWFFSGFYTIGEAERGVVTRLGKYNQVVKPGLSWRPRFIDNVTPVNVQAIRSLRATGLMLTKDENVVTVSMDVQYRVAEPRKYLYRVKNAEDSLRQATDSALRAVVGDAIMDSILTSGRQEIRQNTQKTLNFIIDKYDMGIAVVDVNFQSARPPEQVKDAFDDAIAAREDEERFIREAEAYKNEVLPRATGHAERLKKEAQGYSQRKINEAIGQVSQFDKLLPEYKASPDVTRERLYIDTMEEIYSNTPKALIDPRSGGNMLYLPIDKLVEQRREAPTEQEPKLLPSQGSKMEKDPIVNPTATRSSIGKPRSGKHAVRQGRY